MTEHCVIVGASHAGSQAAIAARQEGWEGPITLIGAEADLPYHRPPLSKAYLAGEKQMEQILLRPASVYEQAKITCRFGEEVQSIDRASRHVQLLSGERLGYDKLILCTGARVRPLPIPGVDDNRVHYLRTADDVRGIQAQVAAGKDAVVIGGGYIGLEVAASLKKQGMDVTVLEAMDRILQRVTCPQMSGFFRRLHTEEGVVIKEGVAATAINNAAGRLSVATNNTAYAADMVVIGIGVLPNIELAAEAGLSVGDGILVNEYGQTSDENIYAAGDCTWHYSAYYGRDVRLESVPNATEQAKTIAKHLNGKSEPYKSLPWFWSDQYDVKLQIAGLSEGFDGAVIRGDSATGRSFSLFYYQGEQLLAVASVNDPQSYMTVRMALTKGQNLNRQQVGNLGIPIKEAIIA